MQTKSLGAQLRKEEDSADVLEEISAWEVDVGDDVDGDDSEIEEDEIACGERLEDGGGKGSSADWLEAGPECCNVLGGLRAQLLGLAVNWQLGSRIRKGFNKGGPGLLSDDEVQHLRQIGCRWLRMKGYPASVAVEPGQPFALEVMQALLQVTDDGDIDLPGILKEGVPTGVWEDIPGCNLYEKEERPKKVDRQAETELLCCASNWASAANDVAKTRDLLAGEVKQGWMEEWKGGLESARERWGRKVAVGKLAVIEAPGKEPRLVGDSSAPNASTQARFPNRMRNPRVADVKEGLRRCRRKGGRWIAITLDVKSAHKIMRVAEKDGGCSFFGIEGILYRYLTCHFGAAWAAYWYGRIAGMLMRLVHLIVGCPHLGFAYVDDTLLVVPEAEALNTACVVVLLLELIGVPLSYHKLRIAAEVQYIGLTVNVTDFSLGINDEKRGTMRCFLQEIREGCRLDKEFLRKGTGRLQWVSELLPRARAWLPEFYKLLNKPGIIWQTLDVAVLRDLFGALDWDGKLRYEVKGSRFKCGMTLWAVGKHRVTQSESWQGWVPHEGACVAFVDWEARKVKVRARAEHAARVWLQDLGVEPALLPCVDRPLLGGDAAADAMAQSASASLGGWFMEEGELSWDTAYWWRLELDTSDIASWFPIVGAWKDDIVFWEALAQLTLLFVRTRGRNYAGGRILLWS